MSDLLNYSSSLEYFDKDRNVILKVAQAQLYNELSKSLIKIVIDKYKALYNPLGLIDDTFQRIIDYQYTEQESLREIYENLSVAYRFKHGDNQLEIVWDGRTQIKKYEDDWSEVFHQWIDQLSNNPAFVKAVLQLTALKDENVNDSFIQNYLKGIVNDYFEVRVLKRNGVKRVVLKTKLKKAV